MKFYIKATELIYIKTTDKFDGKECYSVIDAVDRKDAKNKYLREHPAADLVSIEEIPDGCLTVGELRKMLDEFPYCMPVYIYSDGEEIASDVKKTLAYGLFECIEIS